MWTVASFGLDRGRLPTPMVVSARLFSSGFLVAILPLVTACSVGGDSATSAAEAPSADIYLESETVTLEDRIPRNATLAGLLRDHELPEAIATRVVEATRSVFDPRRIRTGRPYRVVTTLDGELREFRYEIDRDEFLRVRAIPGDAGAELQAAVVPYLKQRALVALQAGIDREHPSLVGSLNASGETVELAIELADVFAGEIDFNNDLRRGDTYQMLFEAQLREGEPSGYGAVLAAEFLNNGKRFTAFRYQIPGESPAYYDENGRSLKRMFLKSPLPFAPRVTSRFSRRRLHPVLKTYRPHLGVDYRAATGTSVRAVASGRVVSAGWSGGSGRMVRLRHSDGYETYYLHLSAISKGVAPGARVSQRQQIGRVGSTGLATAPHLDYRVRKDGRFLNPTSVHRSLPPGKPIPARAPGLFRDVERPGGQSTHQCSRLALASPPGVDADPAP